LCCFVGLRALRKGVLVLVGLCARCARLSKTLLALALAAQGCQKLYWRLRTLRKAAENFIGICARCARLSKTLLAFALAAQDCRKLYWHLRALRKAVTKLFKVPLF
jgi:hypothetical protein